MNWWWLSYADDVRFRGAVIMQATTATQAVLAAHIMGLNPGGQVWALQAPAKDGAPPPGYSHRLLTEQECGEMMKIWSPDDPDLMTYGEWEDEQLQ